MRLIGISTRVMLHSRKVGGRGKEAGGEQGAGGRRLWRLIRVKLKGVRPAEGLGEVGERECMLYKMYSRGQQGMAKTEQSRS
jgi:hypothetical protein